MNKRLRRQVEAAKRAKAQAEQRAAFDAYVARKANLDPAEVKTMLALDDAQARTLANARSDLGRPS